MRDEDAIGFEGLHHFATDGESALAASRRIAAAPPPVEEHDDTDQDVPIPDPEPNGVSFIGEAFSRIGQGVRSIGALLVGLVVLVAVKSCVAGFIDGVGRSPASTSDYSATSAQPTDMSSDSGDYVADNMTADVTPSSDGTAASDSQPIDAATPDTGSMDVGTPDPTDTSMTKPPAYAGNPKLEISQVRYCLAENVRIDAARNEMNSLQFSDPDAYNRSVDPFNDAVADYNSRCNAFQYRPSDMTLATSQIDGMRSELESEGRSMVDGQ